MHDAEPGTRGTLVNKAGLDLPSGSLRMHGRITIKNRPKGCGLQMITDVLGAMDGMTEILCKHKAEIEPLEGEMHFPLM